MYYDERSTKEKLLDKVDNKDLMKFLKEYNPKDKGKVEKVVKRGEYRTDLFLADMRNIDEQIYNIITEYMGRTKAFKHKELWAKYLAFLYVSGARRTEPFLMNPTISKFESEGETYYRIKRVNSKHFEGRKLRRKMLIQLFKAWNLYEKALFEFLLAGNLETTLDFRPLIDTYGKHPEKLKHLQIAYNGRNKDLDKIGAQISFRFSKLFKADIVNKDNEKLMNAGIVPHMLRHIRAYDLFVVKDLPDGLCEKLIGWKKGMVDYYADIGRAMGEKEELDIYKHLPDSKST